MSFSLRANTARTVNEYGTILAAGPPAPIGPLADTNAPPDKLYFQGRNNVIAE
jgi:hypothetical protein